MKPVAESIRQWAIKDGNSQPVICLSDDEAVSSYSFHFSGEGEKYEACLDSYDEDCRLVLTVLTKAIVPEGRRLAMAELLAQINHNYLVIGNFEMATDIGHVRLRSGMEVDPETLTPALIERVVDTGVSTMMRFWPMIRGTAFENMSVACALTLATPLPEDVSTSSQLDSESIPPWARFAGTDALRRWAMRVKATITQVPLPSQSEWELMGAAIIVEYEHTELGADLARRIAFDCGLPLHILSENDFSSAKDGFVMLERTAPAVVYLSPGAWQKRDEEHSVDQTLQATRFQVQSLLRAFNPDRPLICITACDRLDEVRPGFLRIEAFNRQFSLPRETPALVGASIVELIGAERCAPSITDDVVKVGQLVSCEYRSTSQRKLAALRLQRLHKDLGRPLEFLDLVELHTNGTAERDQAAKEASEFRQFVAVHEAGHAAVAIIDSGGQDIPEYSSVVPGINHRGVVLDSLSYAFARDNRYTYWDFRHVIRVSLGGRAAEELMWGREGISNGSRRDLEDCTRQAAKAFAYWGFSPEISTGDSSAENLSVVIGEASASEESYIEGQIRRFLRQEYDAVLDMLKENRTLVVTIAEQLENSSMLDQGQLSALCASHSFITAQTKLVQITHLAEPRSVILKAKEPHQ